MFQDVGRLIEEENIVIPQKGSIWVVLVVSMLEFGSRGHAGRIVTGGSFQLTTVLSFIVQSHLLSPFHRLDMILIMLKGT